MRIQLRPYQEEALAKTAAAAEKGIRRQLGVAATGLGKTVMFSALAERMSGRTLILAHRDELVQQAAAKVREIWPEADVGIVKGSKNETDAQVVVASVQTLSRERRLDQLLLDCAGLGMFGNGGPFGLVVVDEAHHASADSYQRILAALHAGAPPCPRCSGSGSIERAATPDEVDDGCELGVFYEPCVGCVGAGGPLLLGVTATPDRGDGRGLDDIFDQIVWSYDLLWGIRSGFLADVRGIRVTIPDLDLSNVKISRGDYSAGDTGRALEVADAPQKIVAAWMEHALGRRTLVFTPTVAVAEHMADAFEAVGVRAGWVSGETPMDERRATLAAYGRGDLQVLCNCAVLTEGYDEPRTDCVVIARPTKSRALYAQMVGRGTRRHPDKTDCLVLDVVGVTDEHSLLTIPALFGIEKKFARALGDGTGCASTIAHEQEQDLVRSGVLRAEDVELFAAVRSSVAWIMAPTRPGQLRHYRRSLGRGADTVVLVQREEGWLAGVIAPSGTKTTLISGATMELAQGVAEDYARRNATNPGLIAVDAPWRSRPASTKQRALAKKMGIPMAPRITSGELSDLIDAKQAARRSR